MAPVERDRQFRMNLAEQELIMLRELAEAAGVTASDFLRLVIRRLHSEQFGATKPKKKKPQ